MSVMFDTWYLRPSCFTAITVLTQWMAIFPPHASVLLLLPKVHACLVPAERDFLLSCLDEMHRRCDSLVNGSESPYTRQAPVVSA